MNFVFIYAKYQSNVKSYHTFSVLIGYKATLSFTSCIISYGRKEKNWR